MMRLTIDFMDVDVDEGRKYAGVSVRADGDEDICKFAFWATDLPEGAARGSLIGGAPLSRSGLRQVRLLHRAPYAHSSMDQSTALLTRRFRFDSRRGHRFTL